MARHHGVDITFPRVYHEDGRKGNLPQARERARGVELWHRSTSRLVPIELRDERGSLAVHAQLDADARVLSAFTPVLSRTLTKTCHGMVNRDSLMKDLSSMKVVLYDEYAKRDSRR